MNPQPTIGHYKVTAKLGEGGMGAVYRATDTKLGREVAIKVLPESFAADPDRLARFTREAQVLASLNHPNIAAIYGVEDRALVLELVEGQTLAERIAKGPIPLDEALPLIHQLMAALEYAHENGVVHRDLKPANLKVTPDGRLKVLDFGLAKALAVDTVSQDLTSSPTLTIRATIAGMIMGTAGYMSPEQARGGKVDKRSDIWSFGVVVYEMLTGKPLFEADNVSDSLAQLLTKELDFDAAPERFEPLLHRCLERDVRKRLRDIGDAHLLLADAPQAILPAPSCSRPLPWILMSAAVIAACAFAGLWLRGPVRPAAPIRFTMDITGPMLFSPNGRWLVNLTVAGLRVRSLEGARWQLLPGTDAASDVFWSEDSSALGFFSNGRLRTISIDGSNARSLAPAPAPQGGSWRGGASNGTILFVAAGQLQTMDIRSGKSGPLPVHFPEAQHLLAPVFCPEGDGFVYLLQTADSTTLMRSSLSAGSSPGERMLETPYKVTFSRHPRSGRWQIFYVSRDAAGIGNRMLMTAAVNTRTGAIEGEPARLVDALSNWVGSPHASFDVSPDGLIYWRNTTPALAIWRLHWFDRNGNIAGTVGDAAGFSSIALSPDESRLAALQGYPEQHIWLYNLQTGTGARSSSLSGSETNPVWSADGRSLYYTVVTETGTRVMRQAIEGGGPPEVLHESPESQLRSVQDITPDGRYLIVVQPVSPRSFLLDLTAPRESRKLEPLFPESAGLRVDGARLAPDGHSLVTRSGYTFYSSRFPPAGDPPQQIAVFQHPVWPFFSRDGRTLYFVSDQSLYSHPVTAMPGGGIRLGERSLLFKVVHPSRTDANLGAVSRDGKRWMVIATDNVDEARVQMLSDWTTLLPR